MDKNAVALPAWGALGFGFVEAGTVTARAQPGNPKPRIFRLPDKHALINRLGFNNDGADAVAAAAPALAKKTKRTGRRFPSASISANRR
jgi:dihydroorotate dehydrogenase